MKILTFTTLYPNNFQQRHGVFVEQRLKKLLQSENIEAKVVAPVPWFPFKSEKFGVYSQYGKVQKMENRFGIDIYHPRYLVIPKVGMLITPFFLAISVIPLITRLIREGYRFDLIDSHYYYPDGVAAVLLGKWFNKPVTITARGTDINLIPRFTLPRKMILWAAKHAHATITVCQALKTGLVSLGADETKIHPLRNGVDLDLFIPRNRKKLRAEKKITGACLLSVGHLIERKGHHLIIEAMLDLPEYKLLIAGDGKEFDALNEQVDRLQLTDRVNFLGALSHQELIDIYNIADVLILASSREGWANVLLESMACGTPVVATNIWGTPEVVQQSDAGVLINERTPKAITDGVLKLFNNYPERVDTRKYAENFSWQQTIDSLSGLFTAILAKV
jgi:glycosyltransferase involved in cell wall biosynthesis